jgi:LuxR family maltose regulon positive regulatory protein
MKLLEHLRKAAEDGGRYGSMIEILVVQALAHETQENFPAALASLERALVLGEPEGYVQVFVGEGLPMKALLERLKTEGN